MTEDQQGISGNKKLKATPGQRRVAMLLFLAVAVTLMGVGLLEASQYDIGRLFMPCGFKVSHGLPCPTCGYTTALRAFVTGHLVAAFRIQPAACMMCVALLASGVIGFYVALSGHYPHWLRKGLIQCRLRYVFLVFFLVVLLGWTVLLAQAYAEKT